MDQNVVIPQSKTHIQAQSLVFVIHNNTNDMVMLHRAHGMSYGVPVESTRDMPMPKEALFHNFIQFKIKSGVMPFN